jgi:hypothetical protein
MFERLRRICNELWYEKELSNRNMFIVRFCGSLGSQIVIFSHKQIVKFPLNFLHFTSLTDEKSSVM